MLNPVLLLLTTGIFFFKGNLAGNETDCLSLDIDSRLNVAWDIIQSIRTDLGKDLKDICTQHHAERKPLDCSDIYASGSHENGVYDIWPQSIIPTGSLRVYCDMEDCGGWTVIQRRGDFKDYELQFHREWDDYKHGFGDLNKGFWIGNKNLFALTNQRTYQVKIDLKDWDSNSKYAIYDKFWIEDELNQYTLHVSGYNGTAGDSFSKHNGVKFSTRDKDYDQYDDGSCASRFEGGWWFKNCFTAYLNGPYRKGHQESQGGVCWKDFIGLKYSLKDAVMKIRPKQ